MIKLGTKWVKEDVICKMVYTVNRVVAIFKGRYKGEPIIELLYGFIERGSTLYTEEELLELYSPVILDYIED